MYTHLPLTLPPPHTSHTHTPTHPTTPQALLVELLELKAHHAKAAESRTLLGMNVHVFVCVCVSVCCVNTLGCVRVTCLCGFILCCWYMTVTLFKQAQMLSVATRCSFLCPSVSLWLCPLSETHFLNTHSLCHTLCHTLSAHFLPHTPSTPPGHLRNALGYAMSGYCVYRVLASFKALLVGEDFSSDPVSRCVWGWVLVGNKQGRRMHVGCMLF